MEGFPEIPRVGRKPMSRLPGAEARKLEDGRFDSPKPTVGA